MSRFLIKNSRTIGTVPGTLDFIGKQKIENTIIDFLAYSESELIEKQNISVKELKTAERKTVNWINVYGLHNTEIIKELTDNLSIEGITVEDILNTNHIPKYETQEKYKSFIIKLISYDKEKKIIVSEQFSIVVLKNTIITFQEISTGIFESLRMRIRNGKGKIRSRKKDYLVFAVLDIIIDNYLFVISQLGREIEKTGKQIFDENERNIEQKLYNLKTEISYLRMQIRPVRELIKRAMIAENSFVEKSSKSYFNDLIELHTQANETIELYSSLIADQVNTYNSLVGNKMNQIMKVLTIFASIFIPLTFIAGVYGMNFDYMPELKYKIGYFVFWGVNLVIALALLYYFKKKRWL